MNWDQFQCEVYEWSVDNFGDQSYINPLLGIIEEIGEYWETYENGDVEDRKDAIADCLVFMADFTARKEIKMSLVIQCADEWNSQSFASASVQSIILVGRLCHYVLKDNQGIRSDGVTQDHLITCLGDVVHYCKSRSSLVLYDELLEQIVLPVWNKVKKRDWKKNTQDGIIT